jgi:hypothetical protein
MVCAAYGNEALKQSNIFHWLGRFLEGQKDVKDDPRSGCPSESREEGNIKNVQQLLLQNHHLTLRLIVDELDISKDTVWKIVIKDLKIRKLWALCTAHIDCRIGEGPSCSMSRLDCDSRQ